MMCQIDQGGVIDMENYKLVGIGKGVIVISGVVFGIVKLFFFVGYFIYQFVFDEGFKQCVWVGVQDYFVILLYYKKFFLYGCYYLVQCEFYGGEIEMKGQVVFEFFFWGNDGFENGNCWMVGEIIYIWIGVVVEGVGFCLFDKSGLCFGIESLVVFVFQYFWGVQIVVFGICQ